jgi:hypothetical protein
LTASDAHQAETSGTPLPVRSRSKTERYVAESRVHLLRIDGAAAGTFTFVEVGAEAVWMGRLAVLPALLVPGSTVGFQCVRRAMEVATAIGAAQLRSEANPDIIGTFALLQILGFSQGRMMERSGSGARTVEMMVSLVQPPTIGTRSAS